jgi:hypothetical protein
MSMRTRGCSRASRSLGRARALPHATALAAQQLHRDVLGRTTPHCPRHHYVVHDSRLTASGSSATVARASTAWGLIRQHPAAPTQRSGASLHTPRAAPVSAPQRAQNGVPRGVGHVPVTGAGHVCGRAHQGTWCTATASSAPWFPARWIEHRCSDDAGAHVPSPVRCPTTQPRFGCCRRGWSSSTATPTARW